MPPRLRHCWVDGSIEGLTRGLADDMPVSGPDAFGYFRAAGYELLAVTAVARPRAISVIKGVEIHGQVLRVDLDELSEIEVEQDGRRAPLRLITLRALRGSTPYSSSQLVMRGA